jgi:hypothetical protein
MVAGLIAVILWAVLHGSSPAPAPTASPTPPTATTPTIQTTPASQTTPTTTAAPPATSPATVAANQVSVTSAPITAPLPDGFVGLSLEFSTPPLWASDHGRSVSPVLVQLIRNLDPGGHPVIRIGGGSTERSWWPVKGMARPPGVSYALTPRWMTAVRTLAQATGARLLLGVNLAADRIPLARAEAQAYLRRIGRQYIEALQIGNEPEFYSRVPYYRRDGRGTLPWYSKRGTPVYARPADYDPSRWATQYASMLRAIPGVPVAGPDTGNLDYLRASERFLSPQSHVRMMTSHLYALTNCETTATASAYPSVPNLLGLSASRSLAIGQAPFIAFAHRASASFRVDELGSVSCNGKRGVSDTMASALWLADALMSIAAAHADGVNLHTFPHEINNLFDLARSGGQWVGVVHPLYYGALLFEQAAPTGSRLLAVHAPNQPTLRTWATLGPDGTLRVLLLNDSLNASASTHVVVPSSFAAVPAAVMTLTAPSAYSTDGLRLGGVSFTARTATGSLPPTSPQAVAPQNGGYDVALPPASAALLTLRPPG